MLLYIFIIVQMYTSMLLHIFIIVQIYTYKLVHIFISNFVGFVLQVDTSTYELKVQDIRYLVIFYK